MPTCVRRSNWIEYNMTHRLNIFLAVGLSLLVSCTDTGQTGLVVQPDDDKVAVFVDTFGVASRDYYARAISAQCDTSAMTLGEFYSERYGSTKADLLIQFAPPVEYEFPPDSLNPTPDSLVLFMYYNTWFGSSNAPLEISIYEINQQAIDYNTTYYSDLNVADFTDQSVLMGRRVITSIDQTLPDSVLYADTYSPVFRYKFSDEQLQRFFSLPHEAYQSLEAFTDAFKGLYITTKYGASTMVYFNQIHMRLFYHYSVHRDGTEATVNTSIIFPSNREVRQLNRFEHSELPSAALAADTMVRVKAPAGIFPHVDIPVGNIRTHINNRVGDALYNVNSAVLVAEVVDAEAEKYPLSPPSALVLVRESHVDELIGGRYEPQVYDSVASVALYDSVAKSYTFDLAYMMTYEVRAEYGKTNDTETFVVMPAEYYTVGSTSYIIPSRRLGGVCIRSESNDLSPLSLKMVYNGF